MSDSQSFEVDRRELERALGAVRDGWSQGGRGAGLAHTLHVVLHERSHRADRALESAWWTLQSYGDRPEYVETLSVLARALFEAHIEDDRVRQTIDRACKRALAVFESEVSTEADLKT